MPRPSAPALRRLAAAALAAAGVGLVATSVSGIASLDATLAADAARTAPPAHVEQVRLERRTGRDCPEPRQRPASPTAPATY
jgi:hypothetical protein